MNTDQIASRRRFDKPQAAFVIAGAVIAIMLTTLFGIQSVTPGPIPPPGDDTTVVTSTFEVMGIPVKDSTGMWASHSRRFGNFHTVVTLFAAMAGMITALAINLAYRSRSTGVDHDEHPAEGVHQ